MAQSFIPYSTGPLIHQIAHHTILIQCPTHPSGAPHYIAKYESIAASQTMRSVRWNLWSMEYAIPIAHRQIR